ncbi:uncharacterized protein RHIMIDRAFT_232867 [Rhizopus microsporus ATCC 52813]|uniref:Uncharacterized protein n=1 Tax=Rhizopus microsporus ATCC 52813 TaxID=1340429 RepID=A0A2G4T8U0_RHIZD|nr:uncharacterized protein RHIMIDRAFT_232867 [Rhizopus microsporus ATCC 52813]PHZ17440.1 hypothetical protein RHIMIDRAFT_232867 [Rhizopus microsporus ATCC 52813]
MLSTISKRNELENKSQSDNERQTMANTVQPMPSISCKSGFSIQSFHTAIDHQDPIDDTIQPTTSKITASYDKASKSSITGSVIPKINHDYFEDRDYIANIHSVQSHHTPSNIFYYGSLDSAAILGSPAGSYFDYFSEDYEVVLDDGTRQKRSVSLSTIPISTPYEYERKYRGNYNFAYYGEDDNLKSISRRQEEDFYHHLIEQEERCALLKSSTSTPDMIIQDLQPHELSDEDTEYKTKNKKPDQSLLSAFGAWIQLKLQRTKLSYKQKMVLKCSFAYLLGSLFTFIPALNNMLGTARLSSHVIATVTVFFNPSKTIGGIIEAAGYGILYTVCAMLVSLTSMWVAIYLRSHNYYVTSCIVTVGFWLAGSTFILSFIKARYNKPAIATGCGLGFMIIFPVLVKEGSEVPAQFDATFIEDMFAIVTIGAAISVAVCCLVWPMTATRKLKSDINDTLMAIKILLKLLTKTFLLDTDLPEFTANESLQNAINSHRTSFTSLKSSLHDAKREFYNLDIWLHADGYDTIVSSLQRLAQHIGGLRSSCGLQFEVMRSTVNHKTYGTIERPEDEVSKPSLLPKKKIYNVKAGDQRKKMECELRKEQTSSGYTRNNSAYSIKDDEEEIEIAEQITDRNKPDEGPLVQFIKTVRPPMKSLAYTCKQTIIHLQSRFTGQTTADTPSFYLLRQNLAMAISLFEESQQLALTRMYRQKMRKAASKHGMNIKPQDLQSHLMNQFAAQDVFLVYFFVFCLLEFAKELMVLVECVQSVYGYDEEQDRNGSSAWMWIKKHFIFPFWFLCCCCYKPISHENNTPYMSKTQKLFTDTFVPNNHNTLNTLHTPKPKTKIRKFFLSLWGFFSLFKSHNVRYALKSTLIAVGIASLAFIPITREYFQTYKMDWTLITVIAAMTPTVGGTNLVAVLRVLSTMLGSIVAVLFYLFIPHDGPLLLLFTWAFSIPCFWVSLNHKHGRFGTFSLLAYNLIVPFMFNHKDEETVIGVIELATMRCATVSVGVVIGLIVTTYVWPYEARKEMRKGLSDLLIRLSWLYKQLVSEYSEYDLAMPKSDHDNHMVTSVEEIEALARRNEIRSIQLQHIELSLQVSLVELQDLLVHAPNEPRLKGPFPVKTYETILASCQSILDKFLSIRIVILKDIWATQVRKDLMLPASKELMEMAGCVLLYFYLLASALQLKTPLPPYLPPAEKAREMLMLKLQRLPKITADLKKNKDCSDSEAVKDECYMVYYAFVVNMESIIIELDKLGQQMKELFGSLVPDDQWARSFGLTDLEQNRVLY